MVGRFMCSDCHVWWDSAVMNRGRCPNCLLRYLTRLVKLEDTPKSKATQEIEMLLDSIEGVK